MILHVAVGYEAHVGVLGTNGCEECDLVLIVPWLPTVLHIKPGFDQLVPASAMQQQWQKWQQP